MSLSESRALTGVHPWLAVRMRWLARVIDFYGGKQIYISGNRTSEEQEGLFRRDSRRPVAVPGCSQHEYGFAVDVSWLPITRVSSAGEMDLSLAFQTPEIMSDFGRLAGLITVSNDLGHFQVFPGSEFREWAVASGLCDPTRTRPGSLPVSFTHPDGAVVVNPDGSREWVWNTSR